MIGRLRLWLRTLLGRRQFESELHDELEFHLDQRAQQLRARGMDAAAARRQARVDLGMTESHREAVRQARGLALWDQLVQALTLSWRSLRRTPGFTSTAVIVLCVPLTASVLLYTLFATYALHVPPLDRPERWVYLEGIRGDHSIASMFSADVAQQLRADPPAQLEGLFTHVSVWEPVSTDQTRFTGLGAAVSDNFFALTGIPPLEGRLWFGPGDARDTDTLLLSDAGWHKFFDRAPDVVGRSLMVGERNYTVIGVLGRDFSGIMEVATLYFVRDQDRPRPLAAADRHAEPTEIGGFIRPGATLAALNAELAARAVPLTGMQAPDQQLTTIQALIRHGILRETDRADALLAGIPIAVIVLLILLIAAANLANLVLARFGARRHDLALRAALGAGRVQLFVHLLTECLLLGLLAGALSLLLVLTLMQPIHGAVFGLLAEMGVDLLPLRFGIDGGVFALALSVLAAVFFGALPAWWVAGQAMGSRNGSADSIVVKRVERHRLRAVLMTVQLAASVFLVVIAGLVATNAQMAAQASIGYDPAPLVAIRGEVDGGNMARALRQHSTVTQLAATSGIPFVNQMPRVNASTEGRSDTLRLRYVDAQWSQTLSLSRGAGRDFQRGDEAGAPVALLSRRAAARLWPGVSPLGRSVRLSNQNEDDETLDRQVEIVGIVDDYSTGWLVGDAERAVVYLPAAAGSEHAPVLLLRLSDATPAAIAELHEACRRVDPAGNCRPLTLSSALRVQRVPFLVASALASSLAWLALGISCVGLYGLVSYAVVQQRRELGVRFALGARSTEVITHVMRGAVIPLSCGLLLGLSIGWAASRMLAQLTEYLRTDSLLAFVVYPVVLVVVALLAAWLPARRSARIALTECLRSA